MSAIRWNFPSGTDGETLTAVLAGADTVNFAGGTATVSTNQAIIGTKSARFVSSGSGHFWFAKESFSSTAVAVDAYIYIVTAPSTDAYILWAGNSSSLRNIGLKLSASRALILTDAVGATLWTSTVLDANTWIRVSMYATISATVGTAQAAWYFDHEDVPQDASALLTGKNTGSVAVNRVRVGAKASSVFGTGELYIGSWAYDIAATALIDGFEPPPIPPPPPYIRDADVITVGTGNIARAWVNETQVWPGNERAARITVTGTTFAPQIEFRIGSSALATWISTDAVMGGSMIAPTFTWPGSGPHVVSLIANDPDDLRTINFGFSHLDDEGRYGPGAAYDLAPQNVTGVKGLTHFTGLRRFLAANTPLTGPLDFTGMGDLEFIECFNANVTSINLTDCDSLLRCCMEANQLTTLDLNPVQSTLYDIRAADQQGGSLTLATISNTMQNLYHYCLRTQTIVNSIPFAKMPVIEQFWCWDADIVDVDAPISTVMNSVLADQNSLGQADVDAILVWVNENVDDDFGNIDLTGNAAPSATGIAAKNALIARGNWSVTTS